MARQRRILPEFWLDAELAQCDYVVRLFYIATWNFSDDYGVIEDDLQKLRAQIFPYDLSIDVLPIRDRLVALKKLIPFEAEGKKWLLIKNFQRFQTINRPSEWQNPSPPQDILNEYSMSPHIPLIPKRREEKRREEYTPSFLSFWESYPRKDDKFKAFEKWQQMKLEPLQEKIKTAVKKACGSSQWQEDNGRFIPYASTWLNKRRWEDKLEEIKKEEVKKEYDQRFYKEHGFWPRR